VLIRFLAGVLLLILAGCERWPDSYPPPEQRSPVSIRDTSGMLFAMDDPDLPPHIVKDIYERQWFAWRWTGREPTLRILALAIDHVRLQCDFTIWETALAQTGPLELEFFVNGKSLEQIRYAAAGTKHFEKEVPAKWLSTFKESTVAIKIDKLYQAPDRANLGIILSRFGLAP
jgi:hypothetical protein